MVFCALLMPLLFLLAGVALDLGWYYLNVSRLQNAADAAALAGARELIARNGDFFKDGSIALVDKKFAVYPDPDEDILTAESDKVAAEYVRKNLSSDDKATPLVNDSGTYAYTMTDNWSPDSSAVTMTPHLGQNDDAFYYVVYLKEDIRHFLMPGRYEPIPAPVVAVAMIHRGSTFVDELEKIKNRNVVVGNWEVQNIYRQSGNKAEFEKRFGYEIYDGKWNMYQDTKNHYYVSDNHRTETINITPAKTGNSFSETGANGKKYWDETTVESLDIDFKPEITFKTTSKWLFQDWDLEFGYDSSVQTVWNNSWDTSGKYKYNDIKMMRIHSTINFDEAYKVRPNATEDPDILWVRIESETMLHYPDSPNGESSKKGEDMRSFNSIHQIIINFNSDNTATDNEDKDIYRPVVIFYDGPETNDTYYDSHRTNTEVLHRQSLPVIVNLNSDFQGVLYAPNSPVVINDNGYKFNGFIVAKSYVKLKTENDFYKDEETGKYYDSANKTIEYFKVAETKNGVTNVLFTDEYGNVQYSDQADTRKSVGTYDNFNRTNFTTHDYEVLQSSADNLLLSGN